MELTQKEIAELKSVLANRRKAKAKPAPMPMKKVLLVRGGRIAGAAVVAARGKAKLPEGCKAIAFDPAAKIGHRVEAGKAVYRAPERAVATYKDADGAVQRIVVDLNDLPEIDGLKVEPQHD